MSAYIIAVLETASWGYTCVAERIAYALEVLIVQQAFSLGGIMLRTYLAGHDAGEKGSKENCFV